MPSLRKIYAIIALLLVAILFNILGFSYISYQSDRTRESEQAERIATAQQFLLGQVSRNVYILSIHHSFSAGQHEEQLKKLRQSVQDLSANHKQLNRIIGGLHLSFPLSAEMKRELAGSAGSHYDSLFSAYATIAYDTSSAPGPKQATWASSERAHLAFLGTLTQNLQVMEDSIEAQTFFVTKCVIISLILLVLLICFLVAPLVRQSYKNYRALQTSLDKIKKSESLLRTVIDSTHDFIYVKDSEHRFRLVNKAMAAESGKVPQDFIGKTVLDFGVPPHIAFGDPAKGIRGLHEDNDLVLSTGETLQLAEERIEVEGRTKYVSSLKAPVRNKDGEIWGVLCHIHDITDRVMMEKKMLESEHKYRCLFYENPFPMWVFDPQTLRFLEVNDRAVEHYGYTAEEFTSMTILDIRLPEFREKVKELVDTKKQGQTTFRQGQWTHMKKNGELITVEITSHALNYENRPVVLVQAQDITEKVRLENALLEEKINHQRQIAKATIDIQERERNEIGKELHDNVNQILTSAKLHLEYTGPAVDQEQTRARCVKLINTAINEIRHLSRSLVPPTLKDVGLVSSIEDLLENLRYSETKFNFCGKNLHEHNLEPGLRLTVFRILQELTTNVIRYSGASEATIELSRMNNVLHLRVADNGKGFDPACHGKGIGFQNIINRADIYRGKVRVKSRPGQGCEVVVRFRLDTHAAVPELCSVN